mmetsp:Transcript_47751/g.137990  ORF Transcript_47751/g.137990 Transcript_47751/m.137990 type:complete len:303 (+) Transcript_47751:282-1190(+)
MTHNVRSHGSLYSATDVPAFRATYTSTSCVAATTPASAPLRSCHSARQCSKVQGPRRRRTPCSSCGTSGPQKTMLTERPPGPTSEPSSVASCASSTCAPWAYSCAAEGPSTTATSGAASSLGLPMSTASALSVRTAAARSSASATEAAAVHSAERAAERALPGADAPSAPSAAKCSQKAFCSDVTGISSGGCGTPALSKASAWTFDSSNDQASATAAGGCPLRNSCQRRRASCTRTSGGGLRASLGSSSLHSRWRSCSTAVKGMERSSSRLLYAAPVWSSPLPHFGDAMLGSSLWRRPAIAA